MSRSNPNTGLATKRWPGPLLVLLALFCATSAAAQQPSGFDDIAAVEELALIADRLSNEEVDSEFLSSASNRIVRIEARATECLSAARQVEDSLRPRKETLDNSVIEATEDPSPDLMEQLRIVSEDLSAATATRDRCEGLVDSSKQLLQRVTVMKAELSQRFLSNRSLSIVSLVKDVPKRAAEWPGQLRSAMKLEYVESLRASHVLLLLLTVGFVSAGFGVWIRRKFQAWYEHGGRR